MASISEHTIGSVYEPIPETSHIRLLQVHVDKTSRELTCNFKLVCLDDAKRDAFTAISYTWGQPAPPASTITLSNGEKLPLSQTLTDLFEVLRRRHSYFALWIDSLCINQQDPNEKANQVSMMGQIYSSAQEVMVWLGVSTPETSRAFQFMRSSLSSTSGGATRSDPKEKLTRVSTRGHLYSSAREILGWFDVRKSKTKNALKPTGSPTTDVSPSHDESIATGLEFVLSLLARPWFRRVWIIQEVTLNSKVLMLCGDDLVGFGTFEDCVFDIWRLLDTWDEYDDNDPKIQGLWSATSLINLRREYLDHGVVRYEVLLQAAFYYEATDWRDAVFAFRGIGDRDRPVPSPDYTIPIGQEPQYSEAVLEVYRKTAVALLCHGESLDLLALGGIERQRSPGLPTWAPDLQFSAFIEPFVPRDNANWDSGGPLDIKPELVSADRIRVQVSPIGLIDDTCPVFDAYSVADQKVAVESMLKMKSTHPGSTQQDCLEKLAMDLIFGLGIDDRPAGRDYYEYFNEWLQWLRASSSQEDITKISHNKYYRTIAMRVDGWKAFTTSQGDFCVGPACAEKGDMVCTVPGCSLPIIIRSLPVESIASGLSEQYFIVSWCYVRNFMDHETAKSPRPMMTTILQ